MRYRLALVTAAALALAGCRAKEITQLERDEAANDVSDADVAVTIKDWARAEGMYAKAAKLCPDEADVWMNLGIVRMRLHNSGDARTAYKAALSAYKDSLKKDPSQSVTVIRIAYVLTVLGRADEARTVVADALQKTPDDARLREFSDQKAIDKMLADPGVKAVSP
jgi:tetratricopeptide (TPR) repeat protein